MNSDWLQSRTITQGANSATSFTNKATATSDSHGSAYSRNLQHMVPQPSSGRKPRPMNSPLPETQTIKEKFTPAVCESTYSKRFSTIRNPKALTDDDVLIHRHNNSTLLVDHPGTHFFLSLVKQHCREFRRNTTSKVRQKEIMQIIIKALCGRRFLYGDVTSSHVAWLPIENPRQRIRSLLKKHNSSSYCNGITIEGEFVRFLTKTKSPRVRFSDDGTSNLHASTARKNKNDGIPKSMLKNNNTPLNPLPDKTDTSTLCTSKTTTSSVQQARDLQSVDKSSENPGIKYFTSLAELFEEP
jgi:hypothetical protein